MTSGLRFVDWSLRGKLAALIVIVSLLPLAFSTLLDIRDTRQLLAEQTDELLSSRADQLALALDNFNDSYQHVAERLGHVPNVLQIVSQPLSSLTPADTSVLHSLLEVLPTNDHNALATAIVDVDGVVRASSSNSLERVGLSDRSYVQQCLKTRAAPDTTMQFSPAEIGALPAVVYGAPIWTADKRFVGLALVWARASGVWDLMRAANSQAGENSFGVLFDHDGIRIGHTYSDDIVFHPGAQLNQGLRNRLIAEQRFGPKTRELLEDVRAFPQQYQLAVADSPDVRAFSGYAPVNQQTNLGVGRRLKSAGWTVFYMIPEASVLALTRQMAHRKELFGALITLIALAIGVLFAAIILSPIRQMSEATETIAAGDLSTRVGVTRRDELGRLAASFNRMAARVQEQAQELRRSHDQLELRVREEVAERTRTQGLLNGIVESSDDAIISKNLEGTIMSWNPAAERLFGYSAAEALGTSILMIFPPDRVHEEAGILQRIARGESVDHFETVRKRADGSHVEISATVSPLRDPSGRVVGASKIARDIGDRKAQERRLRAQLERLSLLQEITRAIAQRLDLSSIFNVVASTLEDHLPVDFCCVCLTVPPATTLTVNSVGPRSAAIARRVRLQESAPIDIGTNGLTRCLNGLLVYEPELSQVDCPLAASLLEGDLHSMVVSPLGAEQHVFGLLITARRAPHAFSSSECEFLKQVAEHTALAAQQARLYGELQVAYDHLRRTQHSAMQQERLRALGQMASGIAHDINNALSPAALYAQSLLEHDKTLSAEAREQLATIERSIVDVAKTVARMRQFYSPRDSALATDLIDLNALAQHVIDLTRPKWSAMPQERGIVIQVETQFTPGLPRIVGAENEVTDAITNIVLNAVDAMPRGGTLSVRTHRLEEGPVGLEVSDTGIGMDEAVRSRCLEPFFTTKGERGTGLGLAMVYGMAKRHDAELSIASQVGRGTTLSIAFRNLADSDTTATRESRRPIRALHLLAVEDDPLVLQSVRDILEQDGHRVYTAEGGQSGIDVFAAARANGEPFDVVITDLGMPVVDGRAVATAIKSMSARTPVILLTGWGYRLIEERDTPENVDLVLSKPPQLAQLREALAELTGALS